MTKSLFTLGLLFTGLFQLSAQNNWSQVSDMPASARHHPICFTLADTAYVVSGVSNSGTMLNDFYAYVPSTDTWIQKPDYPGPNRGFGVGLNHNGKAYVGFGISGINTVLGDLWEFDASTQTWTELAGFPGINRFHPAFVAKDNKLYVGLGSSGSANLRDWWEYDIATDAWTQKTAFTGDRRHHPYYFTVNNEIYVGLGHGTSNSGQNLIYSDWYRYDVPSDTWIAMASLPSYARVAGSHFALNGIGYVLAGQNQFHATPSNNEVWAYEPVSDTWTQMPDCPSGGRWAPGAFVADGMAFFGFGENIQGVNERDIWGISLVDFISTSESLRNRRFTLYPNPAKNNVVLNLAGVNISGAAAVVIYSLDGKIVKRVDLYDQQISIDVSDLDKGVYTIGLEGDKTVGSYQKLVVE